MGTAFGKAGMISLLLLMTQGVACPAETSAVDELAARGQLGIPIAQARDIERKLGQLLIVNVDGFGAAGPLALEPGFTDLVAELQIGGVIPHYGATDYEKIRRTNRTLAALTRLPLLLCCDIVKIRGEADIGSFGDGYVGGFIGRFKVLSEPTFDTLARLNAFVFSAIGINVALGPTVDTSAGDPRTAERARVVIARLREFAVAPVLKHFPFLPRGANLHKESPDAAMSLADAGKRFSIFVDVGGEADILMTTHLYDSRVDKTIVTFSSKWNQVLRNETGFTGLLMSDGLLMLTHYADKRVLAGGPAGTEVVGMDRTAVWAARAILAGHDLVIVEGSPAQTRRVYDGLLLAACRSTPLGERLRARVEESYGKIEAWKMAHASTLRRQVDVSPSTVSSVIRILPSQSAPLASFRFDDRALTRLDPALRAAEVARMPRSTVAPAMR
jgi:Glycosyl hydrolase family 3 N terminal domain